MPRGRPRKIDPDHALDISMKVFWEKGFEGTSMNELAAATGMAKPGLYAAFGCKEKLYATALTRYFDRLGAPNLDDLVRSEGPVSVVVRRFLNAVADSAIDKSHPGGCFVANSVAECANYPAPLKDLTQAFDAKRRTAFIKRFQDAKRRGELDTKADARALAEFFSGQVLSLALMGRAGASRKSLQRVIDVAMKVLPKD